MAKEQFRSVNFSAPSTRIITAANQILREYSRQGFDLSLRQLYYQFVSQNLIKNEEKEYKRLGDIIANARDAGLIDWNMIVDRGRDVARPNTWDSPADIVDAAAASFKLDLWEKQTNHVMVMVEKQALEGVLEPVSRRERVAFSANKGYASASHLYHIAKRLEAHMEAGKVCHVIYLGDHDPSGMDMGRDVVERLELYAGITNQIQEARRMAEEYGDGFELDYYDTPEEQEQYLDLVHGIQLKRIRLHRVALNMPQIREYNPPPNPAKMTDSRAGSYVAEFGSTSWELDALRPSVLAQIVTDKIEELREPEQWAEDAEREAKMVAALKETARKFRQDEELGGGGSGDDDEEPDEEDGE